MSKNWLQPDRAKHQLRSQEKWWGWEKESEALQGLETCLTAMSHSPARVTSTLSPHLHRKSDLLPGECRCLPPQPRPRETAVLPLGRGSLFLSPAGMPSPVFFLIPKAVAILPPCVMPGMVFAGVWTHGCSPIMNQECASSCQYGTVLVWETHNSSSHCQNFH